jgi:S-adenosylmethionine-diacylgycerolhomoserine-N-methlytransferase
MNDHYRYQSLIYDYTRPFFLLERDRACRHLQIAAGGVVLEVGCGTGYNFRRLVEQVGPGGRVYGVDYSEAMLKIAARRIRRCRWNNVLLTRERAEDFKFTEKADAVLFSYSMSMIDDWKKTLENVLSGLKERGTIVLLDFCEWERLRPLFPLWNRWLKWNHVHIRTEPLEYLREKAKQCQCLKYHHGYICIMAAQF